MSASNTKGEAGAVTAEFMILIPWLLILLAAALALFRLGLLQIEMSSSAHQIARLVARSDSLELPAEYQESRFRIDISEKEGMVCADLISPGLEMTRAAACFPNLGR